MQDFITTEYNEILSQIRSNQEQFTGVLGADESPQIVSVPPGDQETEQEMIPAPTEVDPNTDFGGGSMYGG